MIPISEQFGPTVPLRIAEFITERPNGCWSWSKAHGSGGYPCVWWEGSQRTLHNVLYRLMRGPIPEGLVLDHVVCEDKSCCNPFHVEPETNVKNLTRERREKTHCKHGHNDWMVRKNGSRKCLECGRIYARKRARRLNGIPEDWPDKKHFNRRKVSA